MPYSSEPLVTSTRPSALRSAIAKPSGPLRVGRHLCDIVTAYVTAAGPNERTPLNQTSSPCGDQARLLSAFQPSERTSLFPRRSTITTEPQVSQRMG